MKSIKIFLFILLAFFIGNTIQVSATEVTGSVTVTVISAQTTLVVTPQTVTYVPTGNNFAALATTGGSGGGVVTYSATSGSAGCTITGTAPNFGLSYANAGICTVTATKAADASYDIANSAAATFTIALY